MKNITLEQFQQLLERHLKGITLFEDVVLKIPFETNPDGTVDPVIIDNMRMIFILALSGLAKEAPESETFRKMICLMKDLMPYGTDVISSKTKQFLTMLQKNPQRIADDVTYDIPKQMYVGDDPLPKEVTDYMIDYLTFIINDRQLNVADDSALN